MVVKKGHLYMYDCTKMIPVCVHYTLTLPHRCTHMCKLATHLSISADFDWFVIVPRVLEVHTHRELQTASVAGRKRYG